MGRVIALCFLTGVMYGAYRRYKKRGVQEAEDYANWGWKKEDNS